MPERRVPFKIGDEEVEAWDVPVEEATERAVELKLEDGAFLRLKTTVIGVMRLEGRKDGEGNQMYAVKSQTHLTVLTNPKERRRVQ